MRKTKWRDGIRPQSFPRQNQKTLAPPNSLSGDHYPVRILLWDINGALLRSAKASKFSEYSRAAPNNLGFQLANMWQKKQDGTSHSQQPSSFE